MNITSADYLASYSNVKACPPDSKPEYAFIGRSNVGKSSLINALCQRKGLAKTSSQPGKTQTINFFLINNHWHLIDLPGYGYAKISKSERERWRKMIENYLLQRESLQCAFLLIDVSVPPQTIDLEFMQWMSSVNIPFAMVFTKADRLGETKLAENLTTYRERMLQDWSELPTQFITAAAASGRGREEILAFIEPLTKSFYDIQKRSK